MGSTDKRLLPEQIYDGLCSELAKKYELFSVKGRMAFRRSQDDYFILQLFPPPRNAVVIEYNGFDEGDLFYLEDYDDMDDLLAAVLNEIEQ